MEDKMDSFHFNEFIDAVEHDYRITNNNGKYEVEADGKLLAELVHDEIWKQTAGEPLPEKVLMTIGDRIEDHDD